MTSFACDNCHVKTDRIFVVRMEDHGVIHKTRYACEACLVTEIAGLVKEPMLPKPKPYEPPNRSQKAPRPKAATPPDDDSDVVPF